MMNYTNILQETRNYMLRLNQIILLPYSPANHLQPLFIIPYATQFRQSSLQELGDRERSFGERETENDSSIRCQPDHRFQNSASRGFDRRGSAFLRRVSELIPELPMSSYVELQCVNAASRVKATENWP